MFGKKKSSKKKGYLQVVRYPSFDVIGEKHPVLYETRPLFEQTGHLMVYLFSPKNEITLVKGPGKEKVGLFTNRGELVVFAWDLPALITTFKFEYRDPKTGLWTTKTPDTYKYQEEFDQDFTHIVQKSNLEIP
jgi:hypothetical protein